MVPMSVYETLAVRDLIKAYHVKDIGLGFIHIDVIKIEAAKVALKNFTEKFIYAIY